jgi:D-alanyl-D-alanine carboxypeptidase
MICGALLSACQDGSGSEENQNLNAAGSAQQESDGTTVHLTEDTGKDGSNTGGDDSTSSDNNNEGTDSGSGDASTGGEGSSDAGNGATAEDPLMEKRSISALQTTIDAQAVVTNSEAMTVIVNKQRSLPEGYEPDDLVEPNVPFSFDGPHEKRHMRKEAAEALEKLFAGAKADDIELRAVSGYRSYQRQVSIYNNNVKTKGQEYTDRVSSVPGHSEHQTGLAIDVSSPSVGNAIEEVFGTSKEGQWLAEHAAEYGFIIRYPKGEEAITGYVYEPWHIRYVGTDLAPDVVKSGLTLEEYFDEANIKL